MSLGMSTSYNGNSAAINALGGAQPKMKTVYTIDGQAVQRPEAQPTHASYDPGVGYAGDHYFDTPPPPRSTNTPQQSPQTNQPVPAPNYSEYDQSSPANSQMPKAGIQIGSGTYQSVPPALSVQSPYQERGTNYMGASPVVSQGNYEDQALLALQQQGDTAMLNQRASLSNSAFDKRLAAIQGLNGLSGFGGGSPSTMPFDEAGARAAAFGRAKDQAGMTAHSALQSLQNLMAERGLRGSTVEGQGIEGIINGAAGGVNEFTREQLIQDLGRAAQLSDREAQGNLTRRGQDIGLQQSLLQLLNSGGSLY